MSKTYKDNPSYLKGLKRKKKDASEKYLRHKNREDEDWESFGEDYLTQDSKYYRCIERKMPVFYDDLDMSEDLIDQMDSLNDKESDAA